MKANNFLKVILGTSAVMPKAANSAISEGCKLVEDKIVKGNYVTREEFEVMQTLVIKLQSELRELQKLTILTQDKND